MNFEKEKIRSILQQHQRRSITDPLCRRSAVLMPILVVDGIPSLLFTKRTETVDHHKGQISFPGGAEDEGDASPEATALREAREEIGMPEASVDVLGILNDLQTPSGFIITPVVGWIQNNVELRVNECEVTEFFTVPMEFFTDISRRTSRMFERNGMSIEVFYFDVWREPVWGATANCVKQLMDLLDKEAQR
jgi:8-oxo-dGTP pyrophosphatase MutT (NUDIX family)